MNDVVIISACRTAIGKFGGTLKDSSAPAIAAASMKEAVRRAGIDPGIIEDVRYGCCIEHHDNLNLARVAALMAGIPESSNAVTINRVCISGMEAVVSGMAMIKAGLADVILAGGVEHMSGAPFALSGARWGYRLQDSRTGRRPDPQPVLWIPVCPGPEKGPLKEGAILEMFKGKPYIMGHTAEFVAELFHISRERRWMR